MSLDTKMLMKHNSNLQAAQALSKQRKVTGSWFHKALFKIAVKRKDQNLPHQVLFRIAVEKDKNNRKKKD